MSDLPPTPQHMDKWERNKRVYESLLGMGLVVNPIPNRYDHERIEALFVSADIIDLDALLLEPAAESEKPSEGSCPVSSASVVSPMQGADVCLSVWPSESGGANVVNFPSVIR